jgi:hypothetical protein
MQQSKNGFASLNASQTASKSEQTKTQSGAKPMGPFEMVVMIVAICVAAGVYNSHLKSKRHSVDLGKDTTNSELTQKVLRLEQRVQTLEKLATDPANRLSDEIERLRS